MPRIHEVAIDGRVLGFALAITFLSALVFGLAPTSRVRAFDLTEALRDGRGGTADRRSSRLRKALVVTELALALALVLSAGLLLRSFNTLVAWDPGFEYRQLLTFQIYPPQTRFPDEESLVSFYRDVKDRLEAVPGVTAVGSASAGPLFGGDDGTTPFLVGGGPEHTIQSAPRARWFDVGPGYFRTLGLPLIEGRHLEESDGLASSPVALVNETLARRFWPEDESPVGERLYLPPWETSVTVVGVVRSMQPLQPDQGPEPAIYLANRQQPRWASYFVVRTAGDPEAAIPAVRSLVDGLDPDIEPIRLASLEANLGDELVGPRFNMLLVGLFALVALILGATGVYGVIAYAVAVRTREIGIRMALGADHADVLRSILRDGLELVALGLAAGVLVSLLFTRLLRGVIVGVQPTDPVAIAGTVLVLAATALTAALIPALRAARTDPVEAIRTE